MRTNLRTAAAALLILMTVRGLPAREQKRIWRVGFLSSRARPADPASDYHIGLVRGLNELGYIEGKNLLIEWRYAESRYERLPALAAELIRLPVDILVTDGTPSTLAAQKATTTIPIVFGSASDPVGNRLVQSLSRPGNNTTGLAVFAGEDAESTKHLELLRSIVPRLSRVAALCNTANPYTARGLKSLEAAATSAHLEVVPLEARDPEEIEKAFGRMTADNVRAFVLIREPLFFQNRRRIAELALAHRLPYIGAVREVPEAGGLMSYGLDMTSQFRRAATYVDKILKGAKPDDLPVEQPTKFELVINKKTARALGLTIPPELLVQADKVIE